MLATMIQQLFQMTFFHQLCKYLPLFYTILYGVLIKRRTDLLTLRSLRVQQRHQSIFPLFIFNSQNFRVQLVNKIFHGSNQRLNGYLWYSFILFVITKQLVKDSAHLREGFRKFGQVSKKSGISTMNVNQFSSYVKDLFKSKVRNLHCINNV